MGCAPLCAVLIVSLGRAKLLVLLRSGASDGLPSFFKGVKRDQVGFVCVGQIPALGDVASQRLLLSWVSWVVLLQERLELLEAYLPSHLAVKLMWDFIQQLGGIVNTSRDQVEEFYPFWL